jgi:hypothetical protein
MLPSVSQPVVLSVAGAAAGLTATNNFRRGPIQYALETDWLAGQSGHALPAYCKPVRAITRSRRPDHELVGMTKE